MPKRKISGTAPSAKKQKLDPQVLLSDFEKLPEHTIEKICVYLEESDILNLLLTSKHINFVISNSLQTMSRFKMIFPEVADIKTFNFLNTRKYSKFNFIRPIKGRNLGVAGHFLQKYAANVKYIKFGIKGFIEHAIDKQFLVKILTICDKVQTIEIDASRWKEKVWKNVIPLKLPHIKRLLYPTIGFELIDLFKDCQLKTYEMQWESVDTNFIPLKNYLKSQKNLESLYLNYCHLLFEDDAFSKMDFKLKHLRVTKIFESNYEPNENFIAFANAQRDTLQHLELKFARNFITCFSNFKHIKKLFLDYDANMDRTHFVLESVEDLVLHNATFSTLVKKFPNVKNVDCRSCSIEDDFLNDLPRVEKLTMIFGCIKKSNLSIKKLKSLKIVETRFCFRESFNVFNNQLKEVILKSGDNKWVEYLISYKDTSLDFLELAGINYMPSHNRILHEIIEKNRHKIKCLVVKEKCGLRSPRMRIFEF